MTLTQLLSWIGFVLGMLIGIPQLTKTLKMKRARDVSAWTFILILATSICMLSRVVAIREYAFVCYYGFIICSSLFQLFLIWKYRGNA